jgi:hypothetical protein
MRSKCDLTTNKVIKHKARLNLHGEKQVYGMNYFETYAPVLTWFTIGLMIVFSIIFSSALWQIDFDMVYLQPPVELDIYMELPQGIRLQLETARTMYQSYSRTSTVRSKLEGCGIHSLWTSSPHWATLLFD